MCAWGSPLPVLAVLAGALLLASGLISQREREREVAGVKIM